MRTYKALAAGLALASLLSASVASAQVASTTNAVVPNGNADLAVSIGGTGITLDATRSSVPVQVMGLPISFSGAVGGTCTIANGSATLGTVGTASSVTFTNAVTVPAGQSVTLPVTCTGATPGTYNVTLVTSLIPAIVANTSTSITPRGIGGGSNIDTTAVGTLTIGSSGTGTVTGGTTGTTGTTGGSTGGSVLGTSTGSNLPSGTTSGTSSGTPGVPNTGDGGATATNIVILTLAALAAVGGTWALRRNTR